MNPENPKHNKAARRRVRTQGDIKPALARTPYQASVNKKWPIPHVGKKQLAKQTRRIAA